MAFIPNMPRKGLTVCCNECEKNFLLIKSHIKTKRIKGETYEGLPLYEVFYHCPECNHKYVICKIDQYLKDNIGLKMKECVRTGNEYHFEILQKKYKKRLDLINERA